MTLQYAILCTGSTRRYADTEVCQLPPSREAGPQEDQQPQQQPQKKRRVWEDPDDVTLTVPVAGQARVRKLRQTEEETQLTGEPHCVSQLGSSHNPLAK